MEVENLFKVPHKFNKNSQWLSRSKLIHQPLRKTRNQSLQYSRWRSHQNKKRKLNSNNQRNQPPKKRRPRKRSRRPSQKSLKQKIQSIHQPRPKQLQLMARLRSPLNETIS